MRIGWGGAARGKQNLGAVDRSHGQSRYALYTIIEAGMKETFSRVLHRLGIVPRSTSPGLLFYGSDKGAFEAIAPLLKQLSEADLRLDIFLYAGNRELADWFEQAFPDIKSVPMLFSFAFVTTIFVRRLRIRTVILLEEETLPNATFLTCLKRRSVSIVLMSGRGAARLEPRHLPENGADLLLAIDHETDVDTAADRRLIVIPSSDGRFDQAAAKAAMDRLIPLSRKNRKWINRRDRPLRRMFGRWLQRRLDNPVLARRSKRFVQRFDDLEQIRMLLGNPETILCLGNGPSSEDPRLGEAAYDAMFRVNHSWMYRSVLTDPNVVFTGGSSTMRALNQPIFGLQHQAGEMTLLATKGPWAFRHRLRYFSMERLGRYLDDFDWGQHRPTNGAAMIAMAVALNPKQLLIAGVDLFRHPDGSYPGDKTTPNAYTTAHSPDKELAFMFHHLDHFSGKVMIFGEILNREWRHHLSVRRRSASISRGYNFSKAI